MGIRRYKPTTPGRRGASVSDFAELTAGIKPPKKLLRSKRKTGGRNNQGKITARHRGGGHKQRYRMIDFRRNKDGIKAKVHAIQIRSEPFCENCIAALRRWRKTVHSCPARTGGGKPR